MKQSVNVVVDFYDDTAPEQRYRRLVTFPPGTSRSEANVQIKAVGSEIKAMYSLLAVLDPGAKVTIP